MTIRSINLDSQSTYQAIAAVKKNPKEIHSLTKIAYASLCDAGTHGWHAISRLPSAVINRQLPTHALHVQRSLAHLALAISLPFSLRNPNNVVDTAEFLGLKSQKTNWFKLHPKKTIAIALAAIGTLGALAYSLTKDSPLPEKTSFDQFFDKIAATVKKAAENMDDEEGDWSLLFDSPYDNDYGNPWDH
ncbi:MAG: hypothetical protein Q8K75_02735 [Chlamydiales bacterium]|nr:hypothetical protein [Chlamydiales bacterium]